MVWIFEAEKKEERPVSPLTEVCLLLQCMKEYGVRNLVFSSSATVYGTPEYLPLDEKHPVGGCTNPYGKSKYFIEEILKDLCKAEVCIFSSLS